jgi:hypothetical protein
MVKAAIGILALALSGSALAQPAPISYAEDFEVGYEVDLNQGFYVCDQAQAGVVVESLIDLKDVVERRRKAAQMGCPFRLTVKEGPVYRVVGILNSICEDRQPGFQLTARGKEATTVCGREGHALAVERNGQRKTVILLNMDIDYD